MERMKEENPFLNEEQAHHLTVHGIARNEDGTYSWKFDNYNRVFFPIKNPHDQLELFQRIECPVLLIQGTESWAGDPEKDNRFRQFKNAVSINIEKSGHWVHHDNFQKFVAVVKEFLFRERN